MSEKTKILSATEINQKINRLAWQIFENNTSQKKLIIIGISGRGEILAKKLSVAIKRIKKINISIGLISLDKDNPYNKEIELNLDKDDYSEEVIILVDDVLNSGKTLMYAAKHLLNTPLVKLSIVVLIDRNHNRFPIKADYVGLSLATTLQEYIAVVLEGEGQGVYLS